MVFAETQSLVHKDFGSAGFHLGGFGGPKKRTAPGKSCQRNFEKKHDFSKKTTLKFQFGNKKPCFFKKEMLNSNLEIKTMVFQKKNQN